LGHQQPLFERAEAGRMRVHVLPTDRFKTCAISVFVGRPLSDEEVTPAALIPFVLRRGTERHPETKRFREELDRLYGAGFGFDIFKRGNHHIVQFRLEIIDDRFVSGEANLLRQALALLGQVMTRPALEDGVFIKKYVDAEKNTLRSKLEAVINDKIRYAYERCTALTFPDDPFRHHALGRLEKLQELDVQSLFAFYRRWLSDSQIDMYVVGNTSTEAVLDAVKAEFFLESAADSPLPYRFVPPETRGERRARTITDRMDVTQGKLNIGLVTPVLRSDPRYPAMLLYNGVLGGYPHSKLFTNVREKANLAYYVSSRYDGFKGFVMIQTGIEIANRDKALGLIEEQLEDMRAGRIEEAEIDRTKTLIVSQLKETADSPFAMIAFDFNASITGSAGSIGELIGEVSSVTAGQIAEAARQVRPEVIYFLRDRKEE